MPCSGKPQQYNEQHACHFQLLYEIKQAVAQRQVVLVQPSALQQVHNRSIVQRKPPAAAFVTACISASGCVQRIALQPVATAA
jgi:hypothetical protein